MEQYLCTAYNEFKSNTFTSITIVLGNESCDLDSAISSIVYAAFLDWQHQKQNSHKQLFVSMLDVDREDFPLKTEVTFCLNEHGISEETLIFRNDVDFESLTITKEVRIILVDHHVLSKKYSFLSPYVTEIIDHRPIDRKEWNYREDIVQKIDIVGSCTTLICNRVKELNGEEFLKSYFVCADLLYNVILLDTVNFSEEVNKATPLDQEIVCYLETLLDISDVETERKTKLNNLVKARSDVSGLTASQLLKKDQKIFGDILVPSFPILVKDFLQKPHALQAVSEGLSECKCDLALLLGMELSGALRRDGVVICHNDTMARNLLKFLQDWSSPPLQLVLDKTIHNYYFEQLNLSASRKQYVPVLNEFIIKYK